MDSAALTAVTEKLTAVEGDVIVIGGAIVTLAVVVFGFRWLKAQFF